MKKATPEVILFKKEHASRLLPSVSTDDNKASRGRSLILGGSHDYPGAGILAARGALRAGSGYVMLAQKDLVVSSLENPDFLVKDLRGSSLSDLNFDAVLIGPGFGVNDYTAELILELKTKNFPNVVLDADALTTCVDFKLFPLPASWIVTPHTGELARCLKVSVHEVTKDRLAAIKKARQLFQCVVLLKGHGTLITQGQEIFRIASGNAALAKSGTGDVLAGMITAFRAQGLKPLEAALLGAYVHGATANLWVQSHKDALSMIASDVIDSIPRILWRLRQG
ncbi:NAD(P)H-hydrate dehydratase [Bdellovibrio bacteriovorus]|uniref:ADP-dependent (S)-NAD(P)H-hydrate dehydratase n=1 Tax=Bdellovibrio bacteriovorus TaxID=959 RepID=A0A150WRW0_BDEBC|nr:NAD(P)H-hydrate dehydratase [Bdellovibrio bacteriovorus]KYG67253.1 NAD(P)H-hydrate dehydratase [Bdellovibrio bacteriovorus]